MEKFSPLNPRVPQVARFPPLPNVATTPQPRRVPSRRRRRRRILRAGQRAAARDVAGGWNQIDKGIKKRLDRILEPVVRYASAKGDAAVEKMLDWVVSESLEGLEHAAGASIEDVQQRKAARSRSGRRCAGRGRKRCVR